MLTSFMFSMNALESKDILPYLYVKHFMVQFTTLDANHKM